MNKSSGWQLVCLLAMAVDVSHERQNACDNTLEQEGCTCTIVTADPADLATVSCAEGNLTDVPESLGQHHLRVGSLDLNGNKITHVDLAFLKSYPDLKSLGLRSNGVRVCPLSFLISTPFSTAALVSASVKSMKGSTIASARDVCT